MLTSGARVHTPTPQQQEQKEQGQEVCGEQGGGWQGVSTQEPWKSSGREPDFTEDPSPEWL